MDYSDAAATSDSLFIQIMSSAREMAGWLRIVGVMFVLSGIPSALTIVGLIVAWVPIWLGVLLIQAGNAARSDDARDLLAMMHKLKLFFMVNGIFMIFILVGIIVMFLVMGMSFFSMFEAMGPGIEV